MDAQSVHAPQSLKAEHEAGGAKTEPRATRPKLPPQRPPPCLTNVIHLCELKDLAMSAFSVTSKDAAIQAHKWALLKFGLASCWRVRVSSNGSAQSVREVPQKHTPSAKISKMSQLAKALRAGSESNGNTSNPQPAVYEVWAFGTRQLLSQLTQDQVKVEDSGDGAGGGFRRLGLQESIGVMDMEEAIRSPLCHDVILLLNDAMANRADLLLGGKGSAPGLVRMGDNWVPRMDEDGVHYCATSGVLPAIQLHCFLRGKQLMATLTVKMKRLQHLGEFDTIGNKGGEGQMYPACGVEVVMSPYGVSGLLKSARPSQQIPYSDLISPAAKKEMADSGWGEVESGQLASRTTTLCKSKMVLVEVDGDSLLYPAHRIVRLSASPAALVPGLDDISLDLPDGLAPQTRGPRVKLMATAAVSHMYGMLKAGSVRPHTPVA